jgi:hypothetical protein
MRHQIRERQLKLFRSCHELLTDIKQLGGDGHESIQASLLVHRPYHLGIIISLELIALR